MIYNPETVPSFVIRYDPGVIWMLHNALLAIYLILPAFSIFAMFSHGRPWVKRHVIGAWISGSILAAAVLGAYVLGTAGTVSAAQIAMTVYLAVSLMLLLKFVDHWVRTGFWKLWRVDTPPLKKWRVVGAALSRLVVFGSFALPWVMSSVMVYRPHAIPTETPMTTMELDYQEIQLPSRDGTELAAWFIPSEQPSSSTVLLCHGLGASKAGMWMMMHDLHEAGINVLAIDLRAHGQSGGQLCTFGQNEAQDVLGAVDWLKAYRADDCARLITVGASLGAAAGIHAAVEEPRIDGLVVIGTFDSLPQLTRDVANQYMPPPLNWLVRGFGLPMASLHAGVNLMTVKPSEEIGKIWPRPVLVIHGANDEIIPSSHGNRLYDAAFEPRDAFFTAGSHNGVLDDPNVIDRVIDFVRRARSSPVI